MVRRYVLPEIDRRLESGRLKSLPAEIRHFRVVLPEAGSKAPFVELNDEIDLIAQITPTGKVVPGKPVYLQDINPSQTWLLPPVVDGKQTNYFLALAHFVDYQFIFDFTVTEDPGQSQRGVALDVSRIVRTATLATLVRTLDPTTRLRELAERNWPPAPALFPATLQVISDSPDISDADIATMVDKNATRDFWEERLGFWAEIALFPDRLKYLRHAIASHFAKDFVASICVLVPQIEGLLVAYLDELEVSTSKTPFKSLVDKFRRQILDRAVLLFPRELVEIVLGFIRDGSFWATSASIGNPDREINRHGIVHGAFTDFESHVVSTKFLLLIDALCHVVLHDRIVRGRMTR